MGKIKNKFIRDTKISCVKIMKQNLKREKILIISDENLIYDLEFNFLKNYLNFSLNLSLNLTYSKFIFNLDIHPTNHLIIDTQKICLSRLLCANSQIP